MNLCIATPTMYSQVNVGYAETLVSIARVAQVRGINLFKIGVDSSDIVTARNMLVMQFLKYSDRTHLLMVDSDSEVGLKAMDKLLASKHLFTALPFCKRDINLKELQFRLKSNHSLEGSLASSLTWCLDLEDGMQEVVDGFMPVRRTGFGCVLLTRELLERMGEAWFDRIEVNGEVLSEDTSFCERARSIAKPFVIVDQAVYHCGTFRYGARFLDDPRYFSVPQKPVK
jgi:hypothetical protein